VRTAALKSVAVGFFDGIHLGHRAVLDCVDSVLTFRNHPLTLLAPEKAPRLIMSAEKRVDTLHALGIQEVTMLDFTAEIAALSPIDFARQFLEGTVVHCGENWRFGRQGLGNAEWLRQHGYEVITTPYAVFEGQAVSSSRIRQALARGKMEDVRSMLGRPYALEGLVTRGKGIGAKLGFPTVNITVTLDTNCLYPPYGVYTVEYGEKRAIANFGLAPTMGERAWKTPVLEVHFIDGVMPSIHEGSHQSIILQHFIRPERDFASFEALKRQIADDIANML